MIQDFCASLGKWGKDRIWWSLAFKRNIECRFVWFCDLHNLIWCDVTWRDVTQRVTLLSNVMRFIMMWCGMKGDVRSQDKMSCIAQYTELIKKTRILGNFYPRISRITYRLCVSISLRGCLQIQCFNATGFLRHQPLHHWNSVTLKLRKVVICRAQ